jgi:predicted nucleic acid-binding protein
MAYSGLSREQIEDLITDLVRVAIKIDLPEYGGPYSVDPNDNHVLNLALEGRADAIVTHNLRHFQHPSRALGVGLYTPGDALRFLRN